MFNVKKLLKAVFHEFIKQANAQPDRNSVRYYKSVSIDKNLTS